MAGLSQSRQTDVIRASLFFGMAFSALLLAGCDGCRFRAADEAPDGEELPASEFTIGPPVPYPSDVSLPVTAIKPGHWLTVSQTIKANRGDRRGRLRGLAEVALRDSDGILTGKKVLAPVQASRRVVLPKGQERRFEYRTLAPPIQSTGQTSCTLQTRLEVDGQAGSLIGNSQPYTLLSPQEYLFVVLTRRPERFARLKVADWMRPIQDDFSNGRVAANYRVITPSQDGLVPLPETMLDWTSIAVVLWDDLQGEDLTPRQRIALADWMRFGGRLVVNGSVAAERMNVTGLSSLLAIRPASVSELPQASARSLLESWSVRSDTTTNKQAAMINEAAARLMLDGPVEAGAKPIDGTAGLLARRSIGRGVTIQCRVDLTGDWMTGWGSYDSFINGVVLGRPPRVVLEEKESRFGAVSITQKLERAGDLPRSLINTGFRLFARDAALRLQLPGVSDSPTSSQLAPPIEERRLRTNDRQFAGDSKSPSVWQNRSHGYRTQPTGDLGAWSDNSDVILTAKRRLQENAGIEIPDLNVVLKALAAYLTILIVVNYIIFKLLGRLEYAWFVMPILAIGGAVAVAKVARLDIGFARSQTELAVLEVSPDYSRGHLSRVVAIYNSLSSSYRVTFDKSDGVAAPLGIQDKTVEEGISFESGRREGPEMTGFAVDSNRIGLLRAEQVIDVGGALAWTVESTEASQGTLQNGTNLLLTQVQVVQRLGNGKYRMASVDDELSEGQTVRVEFKPVESIRFPASALSDEFGWQQSLVERWQLAPGETRLIASIQGGLSHVQISPATTQLNRTAALVCTLVPPVTEKPSPDRNLLTDFRRVQTDLSVEE